MESKPLVRIAKKPPPDIEKWIPFLKRQLILRKMSPNAGEDKFVRTATLIYIACEGDESRGLTVYQNLLPLLFSYHRVKQWDAFLERVPPVAESILRVVEAVKAAALIEPVEKAKFTLGIFVDVSLVLPDPKGYVDVCRREGRVRISAVFHPNTVEFIRGRYRGVVGDLADSEYKTQMMESLKTVA